LARQQKRFIDGSPGRMGLPMAAMCGSNHRVVPARMNFLSRWCVAGNGLVLRRSVQRLNRLGALLCAGV
jgi:hypothetical protein